MGCWWGERAGCYAEIVLQDAEIVLQDAEIVLQGAEIVLQGAEIVLPGVEIVPPGAEIVLHLLHYDFCNGKRVFTPLPFVLLDGIFDNRT